MSEPAIGERLAIGIIGAGRVGAVLGAALARAGHVVTGVYAVSPASLGRAATLLPGVPVSADAVEAAADCDLVVLAVPDDALEPVIGRLCAAGALREGMFVLHTSGRYGLAVLDPVVAVGARPLAIHPAMTFTGTAVDLPRMIGCGFAATVPADLRPLAERLVSDVGGSLFWVPEDDRIAYHAALCHGANHLVTLVSEAAEILLSAGVGEPATILRPLLAAALDNVLVRGEDALTGPVARGDRGTVVAHVRELEVRAPAVAVTYRALASATARRAGEQGRLAADVAADLLAFLSAGSRPLG